VLFAGAACEMHPSAILKALTLSSIGQALEQATAAASRRGVSALPAIVSDGELFQGPDAPHRAALAAQAAHAAHAGQAGVASA